MARWILPSFQVEGFRALKRLQLEELKRVNLIVGKNNVGKTYLLEAIRLYIHRGSPDILRTILVERDEAPPPAPQPPAPLEERQSWLDAVGNLFHGRPAASDVIPPIRLGPVGRPARTCEIRLGWYNVETDPDGQGRRLVASQTHLFQQHVLVGDARPVLEIHWGERSLAVVPIERFEDLPPSWPWPRRDPEFGPLAACQFVRSGGPDPVQLGMLWDSVALTDLEEEVTAALRLVDERVERITLLGSPRRASYRYRIAVVKLADLQKRVTLRSMGEGTNRIFGLVLALVNAKDGVLLIDEVENGLHYTVLPRLWNLIITLARRLNVQVFATTHSWDCIKAFQAAIHDNDADDSMLVRLESREGDIRAIPFAKDELGIVTREHIEIR